MSFIRNPTVPSVPPGTSSIAQCSDLMRHHICRETYPFKAGESFYAEGGTQGTIEAIEAYLAIDRLCLPKMALRKTLPGMSLWPHCHHAHVRLVSCEERSTDKVRLMCHMQINSLGMGSTCAGLLGIFFCWTGFLQYHWHRFGTWFGYFTYDAAQCKSKSGTRQRHNCQINQGLRQQKGGNSACLHAGLIP